MNVLLFGATGMIGQGVLRACLRDDRVKSVIAVARAPLAGTQAKLRTLVHQDFTDLSAVAPEFAAVDACFFCLSTSSAGMSEDAYRRITHDFTLAAARVLPVSPAVSGDWKGERILHSPEINRAGGHSNFQKGEL